MSLANRAFQEFATRSARLLRVLPAQRQLACEAGCNHCCKQQISVTALEVLELAKFLRNERSPEALALLIERTRETADAVRGRTAAQQRGTLCPLNQDGLCTAYEARPMLCRGATSFDREACKSGAPVPTYAEVWDAAQTLQERLDHAAVQICGRKEILELHNALLIALELPDAESRWRRGEPVFKRAAHAWFEGDQLRTWKR